MNIIYNLYSWNIDSKLIKYQGRTFFKIKYTRTPNKATIIIFIIQLGLLTKGAASSNSLSAY